MHKRRAINKKFFSQKQNLEPALLYKLVFYSGSARLFVTLLFVSFFLQPLSFIYASEELVEDTTPLAEAVELNVDSTFLNLPTEDLNNEEVANEEVTESSAESPVLEEIAVETDLATTTSTTSLIALPPENIVVETPIISSSTLLATSTNTGSATSSDEVVEEVEVPSDVPVEIPEVIDQTATATVPEIIATSSPVLQVEHNSHEFQFNKEECTSVGDGSFYCNKNDQAPESKPDGVFAAPDSDGDMEIYIRVNNIEQQLTHNNVDDQAPYYDAYSERIVWHAKRNDRYQIMSYDFNEQKEIQLTDENYNNMEPVAYDNITLWQAWLNGNWEIMSFDGQVTKQLTTNDFHDVSPHMRGDFIIWQSQFAEGWKVTIFDTKTGQIEYLDAEAGTKLENPRFVLVYDSTSESGDIQTLGYDPNKKQSFTIGNLPAELPEELPEPDNTGETRALIQSKPSNKAVEIEDTEPVSPAASSTPPDLSLPTLDLSTSTATTTEVLPPLIETPITATTSNYSHIPDLVIPPNATSSEA